MRCTDEGPAQQALLTGPGVFLTDDSHIERSISGRYQIARSSEGAGLETRCTAAGLDDALTELEARVAELSMVLVRVWIDLPEGSAAPPERLGRVPLSIQYHTISRSSPPVRIQALASPHPVQMLRPDGPGRPTGALLDLPNQPHAGARYQRQRYLLSGLLGPTPAGRGRLDIRLEDPRGQLLRCIERLRQLISQFQLKPHGVEFGFGLEDLVLLRAVCADAEAEATARDLLPRVIDPDCALKVARGRPPGRVRVALEGVFLKKEEYRDRPKYTRHAGRIRVESLELHIAEHCNLRCRGCDAISPYNPRRFLPPAEVSRILARLAPLMSADIFKLMGGEPTLHPELPDILQRVRQSGISRVIRLTTNGLLLDRMPAAFWQGLDRLTVSNYSSAPMSEAQVEHTRAMAQRYDVVLNLKFIDQFNHILIDEPIRDAARVQQIYDDCWIRHRSLVVRDGVFFKCTRAAYMDRFQDVIGRAREEEGRFVELDGIPLDAADFAERALAYLNSATPLASCRFCLGAAGRLQPHRQLTRAEVRAGRL